MHSYLSLHTNREGRKNVPSGPKLNLTEYYDEIANHRFLLSPNGDRPECYRIYEALGLGTIPITELPFQLYFHLKDGPILYNTTDWYLHEQEALERLRVGLSHWAAATTNPRSNKDTSNVLVGNRIMVLEEYWMEYVERRVKGRQLRWFDHLQDKKVSLEDFYRKQ
jgi:hypothetical protein